jgi:hypothetical protein
LARGFAEVVLAGTAPGKTIAEADPVVLEGSLRPASVILRPHIAIQS